MAIEKDDIFNSLSGTPLNHNAGGGGGLRYTVFIYDSWVSVWVGCENFEVNNISRDFYWLCGG